MYLTITTTEYSESPVVETLYFGNGTVTYNDTVYYYVTNLQGDVIAILNDEGAAVVQYSYDAWGNILTTTGSMANTLGTANPLTYRGYVYDAESELYYLQSRYYNPEVCRFLNSDALMSTGQGFLGNNMFVYCLNNSIALNDTDGFWCKEIVRKTIYDGAGGGAAGVLLPVGIAAAGVYIFNAVAYWIVEFGQELASLFSSPLSRTERVAKADAEIRRTVEQNSKVRYWSATVQRGYVDIGRPLTFNQAVHEVVAGRSVFAVTWFDAKAVAIAAGGNSGYNNKSLVPEIDSGKENTPGYYYHYHTYNRAGGHVYFLFGEVS